MTLEFVRSVTDALLSSEYGVNRKVNRLNVDPGDPWPPEVQYIGDTTRHDPAADWDTPPKLPALYVAPSAPGSFQGEVPTVFRDGEAEVAIWYVSKDPSPADSVRDTLYTLRAVVQTLAEWLSNDHAADRQRNNVQVIQAVSLNWGLTFEPIGDRGATGAVTLRVSLRDQETV